MTDTPHESVTADADYPRTLADANSIRGELATRLGIELTRLTPQLVQGRMPVQGNRQPFGLLHGGASAAFAETLGSFHAIAAAGPGSSAVGIELSCTHHRGAKDGFVYGMSTPLHVGRTIATFEIVVSNESGERVCTARLTCGLRKITG